MTPEEMQKTAPHEILVVDDIPANLKLLTDILTERGYRVRPASSGRLALRSVAARLPDLILLDVKMPEMDGYEVCRRLKSDEKSRDIPVIFISALDETKDKVKGLEVGGVDFITKPFQAEEILARIETHLTLRCMREQLKTQNIQLQLQISEREQAETALRRSEHTYRTIFENSGTALVIVEEDNLISLANTQHERLTGYSREEVEGKKSWTAFVEEEDLARMKRDLALRKYGRHSDPAHYEFRVVDRLGRIKHVMADIAGIPEMNKSVVSLMDISEQKKMEAELERVRKHESIGILAGGIAHDFNNLLGIVLGNVSLAKMGMNDRSRETMEHLRGAENACLQSKDLVQRLISLTSGREPVRNPQHIRRLIEDAVSLILPDSNVQCDLDLPEDLWPVECDSTQIGQMIMNLVINAKEAMSQGGTIKISARNEQLKAGSVLSLKEGKYIKLSIEDHGEGIREENLTRIFDPYFSTKKRGIEKGMGLGLTTAYSIVKRHGGHISLESQIGVGTTFFLHLPACEECAGDISETRMDTNQHG